MTLISLSLNSAPSRTVTFLTPVIVFGSLYKFAELRNKLGDAHRWYSVGKNPEKLWFSLEVEEVFGRVTNSLLFLYNAL